MTLNAALGEVTQKNKENNVYVKTHQNSKLKNKGMA